MSSIEFTAAEKAAMAGKLRTYLEGELSVEIDRFDAEFLIGFITRELGGYYYNRGLYDAQQILDERLEQVRSAILELEDLTVEQR